MAIKARVILLACGARSLARLLGDWVTALSAAECCLVYDIFARDAAECLRPFHAAESAASLARCSGEGGPSLAAEIFARVSADTLWPLRADEIAARCSGDSLRPV